MTKLAPPLPRALYSHHHHYSWTHSISFHTLVMTDVHDFNGWNVPALCIHSSYGFLAYIFFLSSKQNRDVYMKTTAYSSYSRESYLCGCPGTPPAHQRPWRSTLCASQGGRGPRVRARQARQALRLSTVRSRWGCASPGPSLRTGPPPPPPALPGYHTPQAPTETLNSALLQTNNSYFMIRFIIQSSSYNH